MISQEPDVCYDVCRVTENVNNMSVMALSLDGVIFYIVCLPYNGLGQRDV